MGVLFVSIFKDAEATTPVIIIRYTFKKINKDKQYSTSTINTDNQQTKLSKRDV